MTKVRNKYLDSQYAPTLLTVAEVAEWTKVSTKTVYRWINEGRLEFVHLGSRLYRVKQASVEAFLAQAACMPELEVEAGKRRL